MAALLDLLILFRHYETTRTRLVAVGKHKVFVAVSAILLKEEFDLVLFRATLVKPCSPAPDHGIAKDHGIANDYGTANDHGIANDLGTANDYGIANNYGTANDLIKKWNGMVIAEALQATNS